MKIRRGPKSTGELEVTDESKLESDAWTDQLRFQFNITKEVCAERNSIIDVEVTEEDIDILHRGLEEGRRIELLALGEQVNVYQKALEQIRRTASLQSLTQRDDFRDKVLETAEDALYRF